MLGHGDRLLGMLGRVYMISGDAKSWDVLLTQRFPPRLAELRAPRVPVPFPEDPYEAIRQAYLVGTYTESEPFKDPIETETPESPHTVASPTSLPDSTPPTRHAEESEDYGTSGTAFMAMRVLIDVLSPGTIASISKKVAAMSDSTFLEDDKEEDEEEEGEEEEDEEVEESLDSDSESEDAEDEGLTAEDEGPVAGGEGIIVGDESLGVRVESLGLGGDEAVPKCLDAGQPRVVDGSHVVYIDVPAYPPPPPPIQTPLSPEWWSGSLLVSPTPSIVPSPISSPMIPLTIPSPVASPATAEAVGLLTELGAHVEMQGGLIHDYTVRLGELSPALFERYDRDIGGLFTRVPGVGCGGQTDAQRAALWHAISDTQMENQELQLQIIEERRVRLDLAKIVDSMRRGQEPKEMCGMYGI
ncbi:hypothetical protein Tco_0947108 [Tanacetum coccineum]